MKRVLVDSSVWISYFRDNHSHSYLDELISHSQICTNNLILSELIPVLKIQKQHEIIELLTSLPNVPLRINWEIIINLQVMNLDKGIHKVGIPDLIILDNVISGNLILYTEDRHFRLMQEHVSFDILEEK